MLAAALWASIPYDFLIKLSARTNLYAEQLVELPLPEHEAILPLVMLRALRLNCLSSHYATLWTEVFRDEFSKDRWTSSYSEWPSLGVNSREWTWESPLRSEYERRAALVELDALAAIMLGLREEDLALAYRAHFPTLRKYEHSMYFDNQGRKIAKEFHAQGVCQQKNDYKLLLAYQRSEDCGDLLDRYEPHPDGDKDPALGFIRPDRETEMRAAYAEFSKRLALCL